MTNERILEMIDEYLTEPHNINKEWVEALLVIKNILIEEEPKISDNDIMKAKEHYKYGITHDIFKEPVTSYAKTVLWAFNEIERQNAEIERLKRNEHSRCNRTGI